MDGYEISPHPVIRKKAAAFMVNINPGSQSEKMGHHTHCLKHKKTRSYAEGFCRDNTDVDIAWIPWELADSIKQ